MTEGALYALRYVCEMNDWSPHLTVAGDWLFFLGTDHFGRILYFDYATIRNPALLEGLKRMKVLPPVGEMAPALVLSRMN